MRIEPLDIRNSGKDSRPLADPRSDPRLPRVLLGLARRAIEHRLTDRHQRLPIPDMPQLQENGACFVALYRDGTVRGCMGSPVAWRSLAEDVIDNAPRAAFSDRRFPPVRADEMIRVTLSVALLTPAEPMAFRTEADLLSQLRPGVDGLMIEDRGQHALFLPAVWDHLPDPKDFLGHLKVKAGLDADHWSDRFEASRFVVREYREG